MATMYGQTMWVTLRGRTYKVMADYEGFLWREVGTYGGPNWVATMADFIACIEAR